MELLAATPHGDHQVGGFQQPQVLGDCLAAHVEMLAKFAQGLTVINPQNIQQLSAAGIGERLKNPVLLHGDDDMEPNGCMSRGDFSVERKAWTRVGVTREKADSEPRSKGERGSE